MKIYILKKTLIYGIILVLISMSVLSSVSISPHSNKNRDNKPLLEFVFRPVTECELYEQNSNDQMKYRALSFKNGFFGDDELTPPWDFYEYDKDVLIQGQAQGTYNWDVDQYKGWARATANAILGKSIIHAWFGHFSTWQCPRNGMYEVAYFYSYNGLSSGQYNPPYNKGGNAAIIWYEFDEEERTDQVFGKSTTHSLSFHDTKTFSTEVYAEEGREYMVGAYFSVLATAESYEMFACGGQIESNGYLKKVIIAPLNDPPNKPNQPIGQTSGRKGKIYTYSTSSSDPNGDQVKYGWNWTGKIGDRDLTVDVWTDFIASGESCETTHKWDKEGSYSITVKAQDKHGVESDWSDPLTVSMPKNKLFNMNPLLQRTLEFLGKRFPYLIPSLS